METYRIDDYTVVAFISMPTPSMYGEPTIDNRSISLIQLNADSTIKSHRTINYDEAKVIYNNLTGRTLRRNFWLNLRQHSPKHINNEVEENHKAILSYFR